MKTCPPLCIVVIDFRVTAVMPSLEATTAKLAYLVSAANKYGQVPSSVIQYKIKWTLTKNII